MRTVPNPAYEDAEFEISYIPEGLYPMITPSLRFRKEDVVAVIALMQEYKWDEVMKLAVPSHIEAP